MDSDSHSAPPNGIAGLVLASGSSERFGAANKLTAQLGGMAIVRRTLVAYLEAALYPVVLVVGHQQQEVIAAVRGLDVIIVRNPDFRLGQSRALVRGMRALPADAGAAVIGVGDQPFLTAAIIDRLIAAYQETGKSLVVPRYQGSRGNPVLFDRAHFPALEAIEGDQGGRMVLASNHNEIVWVEMGDARPSLDIDTESDLARAQALIDTSGAGPEEIRLGPEATRI